MTEKTEKDAVEETPSQKPSYDSNVSFEDVGVGITRASELTGADIGQIQYWTDKGYVESIENGSYLYDFEALRKIELISGLSDRGGKENGMGLKTAVKKAEEIMESRDEVGSQAIYRLLKEMFEQRLDKLATVLTEAGLAEDIIEVLKEHHPEVEGYNEED